MAQRNEPEQVGEVLDALEHAGNGERISIFQIARQLGESAFGPLLLAPSLILVTPVSSVPGMPTIGSLAVSLVAFQLAIGRKHLWLPRFIGNRTVAKQRLEKALGYLRRPADFIDRAAKRRLVGLTRPPVRTVLSLLFSPMGLFAPLFELTPLSITIAAVPVALFALALVTKDGLFVILCLAMVVMAAVGIFMLWR